MSHCLAFCLILLAPIDLMFCRFAAADADIGDMLFLKGDAAGFDTAGFLFDFFLTGRVSTPHGFDKTRMIFGNIQKLIIVVGGKSLCLEVFQRTLIQAIMDCLKCFWNLLQEVIKGNKNLLQFILSGPFVEKSGCLCARFAHFFCSKRGTVVIYYILSKYAF